MEDNKVSIDQYELGSLKELNLSFIKNEISNYVMEQEYYENEEEELEESDSVNEQVQEEKENDDGKNKSKRKGK